MRGLAVSILFAFVTQTYAKELLANHTDEAQDAMDMLVEKLSAKPLMDTFIDKFFDRLAIHQSSSFHPAELESTTVGKPSGIQSIARRGMALAAPLYTGENSLPSAAHRADTRASSSSQPFPTAFSGYTQPTHTMAFNHISSLPIASNRFQSLSVRSGAGDSSPKTIAVLAGDGIGPEVMDQALRVLDAVGEKFGRQFAYEPALIGGAAYDVHNSHFPDETLQICQKSDAVLFGSVGGPVDQMLLPKWKGCEAASVLGVRKAFQFSTNIRPAKVYPALQGICPLKDRIIANGIDIVIFRELLGDLYFGARETKTVDGVRQALDSATYDEEQIKAVMHPAFKAAQKRKKVLHSIDKANVLDTSRLWRTVAEEVAKEYPDVELVHTLVDNCAMQLIVNPGQFDVIVTSNMFGDILSDAAAVLPGSLGLMPSASLNAQGFGMYEPSGGSAPDIAGKGIANPIAQILSAAMMLRYSFGWDEEAKSIEKAIQQALADGARTGDITDKGKGEVAMNTVEMTEAILKHIQKS